MLKAQSRKMEGPRKGGTITSDRYTPSALEPTRESRGWALAPLLLSSTQPPPMVLFRWALWWFWRFRFRKPVGVWIMPMPSRWEQSFFLPWLVDPPLQIPMGSFLDFNEQTQFILIPCDLRASKSPACEVRTILILAWSTKGAVKKKKKKKKKTHTHLAHVHDVDYNIKHWFIKSRGMRRPLSLVLCICVKLVYDEDCYKSIIYCVTY